jgi:hypothetical protein
MQSAVKAIQNPSLKPANAGLLQRQCACGQHAIGGECEECSKKKRVLQRALKCPVQNIVPPIVNEVLRSPGKPLDAKTRTFMEPRFGKDFSRVQTYSVEPLNRQTELTIAKPDDFFEQEADRFANAVLRKPEQPSRADLSSVRVHIDANASESAKAMNALAYTVGQDIVFGAGMYAPGTAAGNHLLAHELTHVMQQVSGLVSRRVAQCAKISYRTLTWADFKGRPPATDTKEALTSSGFDIPSWRPTQVIDDTKKECTKENKSKSTEFKATISLNPVVFDSVVAYMDQDKSWAKDPLKDSGKAHCPKQGEMCENEFDKTASKAKKDCQTTVDECSEKFKSGSSRYEITIDGTKLTITSADDCTKVLPTKCQDAWMKLFTVDLKDANGKRFALANTKGKCKKDFVDQCNDYYAKHSPLILKHEQGHFDISNVMADKARKSLKAKAAMFTATETKCGRREAINAAVKSFDNMNAPTAIIGHGRDWKNLNDKVGGNDEDYDQKTDHGNNDSEQTAWEAKIAAGLKEYDLAPPAVSPAPAQQPSAPTPQQTP